MLPVTESQLLLTSSPNVLLKSSASVMTHCSQPQDDSVKKTTGSVADHVLLKLFCCVPENKIHAAALCCCYPLSLTCQPISHTAQALNRVWMVEKGEQTPSCSSMLWSMSGLLMHNETLEIRDGAERQIHLRGFGVWGTRQRDERTREVFVQPMRHSFIRSSTLPLPKHLKHTVPCSTRLGLKLIWILHAVWLFIYCRSLVHFKEEEGERGMK